MSEVNSAGFSTTVLPAASAGAIFHASISSGKFQGMIWPDHADRHLIGGNSRSCNCGPARVMIEMSGGQRHVEIAGLADRLAVVERLQHRKQPGMALQHAGQCIEMTRAAVAAELCPQRLAPCARR